MSPHIITFLKISIIINVFVMTVLVVIAANGVCDDGDLDDVWRTVGTYRNIHMDHTGAQAMAKHSFVEDSENSEMVEDEEKLDSEAQRWTKEVSSDTAWEDIHALWFIRNTMKICIYVFPFLSKNQHMIVAYLLLNFLVNQSMVFL